MDIFGIALARFMEAAGLLFRALSFGAKTGKKVVDKRAAPKETEFWMSHNGSRWHVTAKVYKDGRVDAYISPERGGKKHFHVFHPDRHEGSNEWVTLTMGKGGENHIPLNELPASWQRELLGIMANLEPDRGTLR